MSRFVQKGCRVLYVQPSFSMARAPKDPGLANNRLFSSFTTQKNDRLYLFYPPRLLPKPSEPISARLNYLRSSLMINQAAGKIGMNDPVLWIYRPEYAWGLRYIRHSSLVFDLVDDLSAYEVNPRSSRAIEKCVSRLASESDLFIATSTPLLDKYGDLCRTSILVPNGFDSSVFSQTEYPSPSDLADIPGPVIGFVGTLFRFLDYDLLYDIAKIHADKSFVFVGPIEKTGASGVEKLKTLKNCHFLGRKDKSEIPAYIHHFNACINPFKIDDVSKSVSPLKVYEYLACGKPVISVPMEGLRQDPAGKYVDFANNTAEFSEKIGAALDTDTTEKAAKRMAGIQEMSWDHRFSVLYAKFRQILEDSK